MVTLKYVIIILHADNEGEGGTFSCYSLLTRYVCCLCDPGYPPLSWVFVCFVL
jgi:K+ transporter